MNTVRAPLRRPILPVRAHVTDKERRILAENEDKKPQQQQSQPDQGRVNDKGLVILSKSDVEAKKPIGENTDQNKNDKAAEDNEDDDPETLELAKLRCPSLRTEEVAQRQRQRHQRRCADYPGLAFGSPMFGSDTLMKLGIIRNELHNIERSQLRRIDGDVRALAERIDQIDARLTQSEGYIRTATVALADAVETQLQEKSHDQDDVLSQFDAQMRLLEGKLEQAKALARCARE